MNRDHTTLEWEANNVDHGNVNLNLAKPNFNDFICAYT